MARSDRPPSARPFVPITEDLEALRTAARRCTGCDLYRRAVQTVFGEGPKDAELVLVGEQPGDVEDRLGHPFIGPAGRILDRVLEACGIPRERVYVTNAVKHFKWKEQAGSPSAEAASGGARPPPKKRRIHDRPSTLEIRACKPWLDAELAALSPKLIVLLGATAVESVLGSKFKVIRDRGRVITREGDAPVLITIHPSAVLRTEPGQDRTAALETLMSDFRVGARHLEALQAAGA